MLFEINGHLALVHTACSLHKDLRDRLRHISSQTSTGMSWMIAILPQYIVMILMSKFRGRGMRFTGTLGT